MSRIHIVKDGRGSPLVLFHGWGFDSHIWQSLVPHLSLHHELYRVDLPGFGKTPFMAFETFQEALLASLPQTFALLGWSLGGLHTTQVALNAPDRVTHLIQVGTSPKFIEEQGWPGVTELVFASFHKNLLNKPQKVLRQFIQLQLQGLELPTTIVGTEASLEGMDAGLQSLYQLDFRSKLSDLKAEVHYLFGRLDAITKMSLMTIMQEQYPKFNYHLFPKAGHAPFLSHPVEFSSLIRNILS